MEEARENHEQATLFFADPVRMLTVRPTLFIMSLRRSVRASPLWLGSGLRECAVQVLRHTLVETRTPPSSESTTFHHLFDTPSPPHENRDKTSSLCHPRLPSLRSVLLPAAA